MQDGQQPTEPGWVFKPGDQATEEQAAPPRPESTYDQMQPSAQEAAAQDQVVDPMYAQQVRDTQATALTSTEAQVTWTASEYIANPKSGKWFGMLTLASVLLAALVFLITRDFISTAVIAIVGILFGIFAARQPRTLQYSLDNHGIQAGVKFYPYSMFKSFSVSHDHAMAYISLLPMKRFMPPLTIHYAPEDESQIAGTLADYLPYEDHHTDVMDNISRKIRF